MTPPLATPAAPAFESVTLLSPTAALPSLAGAPFTLLLWDHSAAFDAAARARVARAVLDAGCAYAVCGGHACEAWHDAIDEELVARELATPQDAPAPPLVPTTWHAGEPPEEVAFFFMRCVAIDDAPPARRVVLHLGTSPAARTLEDALRDLARDG
jgi:hypothetical protein